MTILAKTMGQNPVSHGGPSSFAREATQAGEEEVRALSPHVTPQLSCFCVKQTNKSSGWTREEICPGLLKELLSTAGQRQVSPPPPHLAPAFHSLWNLQRMYSGGKLSESGIRTSHSKRTLTSGPSWVEPCGGVREVQVLDGGS